MTIDATIGGASADSYVTLTEYQIYATAMGWTLGADSPADEVNLRRAAVHLDTGYFFTGYRVASTQARDWPRVTGLTVDGWPVASDTIPQAVKDAQCEAAYAIQGGVDPMATVENEIASEKKGVGPLSKEVTYRGSKGRPRLTAVELLLRPYLASGPGQARMVRG